MYKINLTSFILFLLGLSVGSFLNVVIDRLPKGIPIAKGRSYCDFCSHKLAWYDLIPLVSFILLERRCRYCRKKISWQYPLVELTSGILFFLVFERTLNTVDPKIFLPTIIYILTVFSILFAIFFIDLKYRIIPDSLVVLLVALTLFFTVTLNRVNLSKSLLAGLGLFFLFLAIFIATSGRGMGFGDVKLSFFMGLFLGIPRVVVGFYLSFLTGAIFSLILIMVGKKKMKDSIPFGPFLVTGCLVSYFFGLDLWYWFINFLGIS